MNNHVDNHVDNHVNDHPSRKSPLSTLAFFCVLFIIDRITKYCALYYCTSRYSINSFLAFDLAFNRGVSWGILNTESVPIFYAVTLLVIAITLGILYHTYMRLQQGYHSYGELLIITGSLSNIVDRFTYAGVIDFIELSYKTHTWPVFNCADMYIVVGVIIMLIPLYQES